MYKNRIFKVAVVGDVATGKTSFLHFLTHGSFREEYVQTHACEIRPKTFHTNYGPIPVCFYDVPAKYPDIDEYCRDKDLVLCFYDISHPTTQQYIAKLEGKYPSIPVCNKDDNGAHGGISVKTGKIDPILQDILGYFRRVPAETVQLQERQKL